MRDWSDDLVLRALQDLEEPVGDLIRAFPGRDGLLDDPDWLAAWFIELANEFAAGKAPDPKTIVASAAKSGELSLLAKPPVKSRVRLLSIQARFFRGFRRGGDAIQLDADLIVAEGRNSSGKTSLSEAIEWVITGQLSRRTSGQYGHARELADCISNEFRPPEEHTSVELRLSVDDKPLVLKRVLRRDYSTTASDEPESELFVDNAPVTREQELDLRQQLFAGVHPILMQHNLRRFVHDDPTSRRQYFERLLQIDELTALIEKAVIGPARLKQLTNPTGGTGLAALSALIAEVPDNLFLAGLRKIDRLKPEDVPDNLSKALVAVAKELFLTLLAAARTLGQCRDLLSEAQREQREARLPLLSALEKPRQHSVPSVALIDAETQAFQLALREYESARSAAELITENQQQLARVIQSLIDGRLINPDLLHDQPCPVCIHSPNTLTKDRIRELTSWNPLTRAADTAASNLRTRMEGLDREITHLLAIAHSITPVLPPEQETNRQLLKASQRIQALAQTAVASAAQVAEFVQRVQQEAGKLRIAAHESKRHAIDSALKSLSQSIEALTPVVTSHREHVGLLEEAVGAASRDDASYRLREKWLDVAGLITAVAEDVAWERAKTAAKNSLDSLRDGLIALRGEIIEEARETFSKRITEVWHLLRSDSGARFSQLSIPDARGKGYKLEFELKAVISDGASEAEVDALRVFSESQVNVIGLAAYVTRAKLLGHKLLIFDDPVQSMDEEHFRSFAAKLLPALLGEGLQILILTHSDTFSRRIHDHHYDRLSYVSLETRATKKLGCQVQEGNRRVSERLKTAERLAADGDLQNAWRLIRLGIERLYTLAYLRAHADFDPETWRNLTAEDMWNRGVAELVETVAKGSGKRLKEILSSTVAGAHDVSATSETDVVDAAKFLRGLLTPLRLGAG